MIMIMRIKSIKFYLFWFEIFEDHDTLSTDNKDEEEQDKWPREYEREFCEKYEELCPAWRLANSW